MVPSNHHRNELGIGAAGGDGRLRQANGTPGQDDWWLRSVVEHSSEIVAVIDPDGTLRYANPAFGRVLGYDPGEAAGRMNVLDHVHSDDLPHVLEETKEALAEGGVATNRAEYRFRQADGSWRWMESVGTYLLDDPAVGALSSPPGTSPSARRPCAGARSGSEVSPTRPSRASSSATREKSWRPTAR